MNNFKKLLVIALVGAQFSFVEAAESPETPGRFSKAWTATKDFTGNHKATLSTGAVAVALAFAAVAARVKVRSMKKSGPVAGLTAKLPVVFAALAGVAAVATVASAANDAGYLDSAKGWFKSAPAAPKSAEEVAAEAEKARLAAAAAAAGAPTVGADGKPLAA